MKITLTRTRVALVVAAAIATAIGGVSYAAIPAANGTISACKDSKGALKVIDAEAGQGCASNQQLLTWNQQGPQGLQGPAGPQGPAGTPGLAGVQTIAGNPSYVGSGDAVGAFAQCPTGKKPIAGGGGITPGPNDRVAITASYAGSNGTWNVIAREMSPTSNNWSVAAQAICATVG